MKAILVTAEAAPVVVEIPEDSCDGGETLGELQRILGGYIEALPFPYTKDATVYINEEGKFTKQPNPMASALMAVNLMPNDAIYGPMLICGFDEVAGRTTSVPDDLIGTYCSRPLPEAADMSQGDGLGG